MSLSAGNISGAGSEIEKPPPIARILLDRSLKVEHETDEYGNLMLTFHSHGALSALAIEAVALRTDWEREFHP